MTRPAVLHSRRARTAAAFASVATAALATSAALALPASAASYVTLIGQGGNQAATCAAGTHNVNTWIWPVEDVNNGCGTRVWLHGDTGWSYCVSPGHDVLVPSAYRDPINFQVTSNRAAC